MCSTPSFLNYLPKLDLLIALALFFSLFVIVHLLPFLADPHSVRGYPGPLLARFSDIWLGWVAARGHINADIHNAHRKYGVCTCDHMHTLLMILSCPPGKFVRLAPNHVSISDSTALQAIYAHSSGHGTSLKSAFYGAFVPFNGTQTIFTTRSREEHSRKRKLLAHTFSQRSIAELEPVVRKYNRQLLQHWDQMCADAVKGKSGVIGECSWQARSGYAFLDCLLCECSCQHVRGQHLTST